MDFAALEWAHVGGSVDFIAFGILLLAMLRGMSLGLVREVFSLGAARGRRDHGAGLDTSRSVDWLQRASGSQLPDSLAPWLAGFLLAVGALDRRGACSDA